MPKFLSSDQRTLLISVLDHLIPAHGALPAAGQSEAVNHLDGVVSESTRLIRLFTGGLRGIERRSAALGTGFQDMSGSQRVEILRDMETAAPDFFEALLMHTYNGYYTDPIVVEALGLEPRPPQPVGHVVDFGDFSALEDVAARGQAYRGV